LAGRKTFDGANPASIIATILMAETPALPAATPPIAIGLDRLIATCLAKDPDERWQDARDVVRELRWIAEGAAAGPAPVSRAGATRAAGRLWMAATVVLTLIVLALGFTEWRRAPATAPPIRFTIAPPPHRTFYDFADPVRVSPDGRRFAFVTLSPQGKSQLYLQSADALDARPLAGTEGGVSPFWSPDGRSLAFFADNKLKGDRDLGRGGANDLRCAAGDRRRLEPRRRHCDRAGLQRRRIVSSGGKRRCAHNVDDARCVPSGNGALVAVVPARRRSFSVLRQERAFRGDRRLRALAGLADISARAVGRLECRLRVGPSAVRAPGDAVGAAVRSRAAAPRRRAHCGGAWRLGFHGRQRRRVFCVRLRRARLSHRGRT
jgi:hypothetical protein